MLIYSGAKLRKYVGAQKNRDRVFGEETVFFVEFLVLHIAKQELPVDIIRSTGSPCFVNGWIM